MKGVVFTEFLDFVAARHGEDMVDDIIEASALPSGGAYTAVGTYNHEELVTLCSALAAATGENQSDLVRDFGTHLSSGVLRQMPSSYLQPAFQSSHVVMPLPESW